MLFRHAVRAGWPIVSRVAGSAFTAAAMASTRAQRAGGNEPAVDPRLDQLGVTGDVSGDHGTAQGERFEEDPAGRPSAKLGKIGARAARNSIEYALVAQGAE